MAMSSHNYPKKIGSVDEVLLSLKDSNSDADLIMIHGIADTSDVWREVCSELKVRFRSYQELSLPWSTEVGEPISYEPAPEDVLKQVWKKLPKGKKVVLAHSFGANCLLAMAQTEPLDDVEYLVLLSVYYKPRFEDFSWPLFIKYVNEFEKFLSMSIDARKASKSLNSTSKKIIRDKAREMYNPPSWVQFYIMFSTTPGLNFSQLSMPVLVMTGRQDFSIEVEDSQSFANKLVNSKFECIEHCGHFAMLEDPKFTAKKIQNFIS